MTDDRPEYRFTAERLKQLDEIFVPEPRSVPCPVCGAEPVYVAGYCKKRWNNPKISIHSPIANLHLTCPTKGCAMGMHYSISEWIRHSTTALKRQKAG